MLTDRRVHKMNFSLSSLRSEDYIIPLSSTPAPTVTRHGNVTPAALCVAYPSRYAVGDVADTARGSRTGAASGSASRAIKNVP
jgi:hypothetical protein